MGYAGRAGTLKDHGFSFSQILWRDLQDTLLDLSQQPRVPGAVAHHTEGRSVVLCRVESRGKPFPLPFVCHVYPRGGLSTETQQTDSGSKESPAAYRRFQPNTVISTLPH